MKKERSCSGGMFDFPPTSPGLSRRSHSRSHSNTTAQRLRNLQTQAPLGDVTIFHIPGLDVKVLYIQFLFRPHFITYECLSGVMQVFFSMQVHYESKTVPDLSKFESPRRSMLKKAALFAWATLQSIPEETVSIFVNYFIHIYTLSKQSNTLKFKEGEIY